MINSPHIAGMELALRDAKKCLEIASDLHSSSLDMSLTHAQRNGVEKVAQRKIDLAMHDIDTARSYLDQLNALIGVLKKVPGSAEERGES